MTILALYILLIAICLGMSAMLDMDVGHATTQCDTQQLLLCNHAFTYMIMCDNVKL